MYIMDGKAVSKIVKEEVKKEIKELDTGKNRVLECAQT